MFWLPESHSGCDCEKVSEVMKCAICSEAIAKIEGQWVHSHGDTYCGTGDGSTAYPERVSE